MSEARLPSGKRAPLRVPTLADLLASKGGVTAILEKIWDGGDDLPAADIEEGYAHEMVSWALDQFGESNSGMALASVCERYGTLPSVYLRIRDPHLAWKLDYAVTAALADSQKDESSGRFASPPGSAGNFSLEDPLD
jgi:hypothetical protein